MSKSKLLIVDDEEAIREVVSTLLETLGYECASVSNGRLAKEYLLQHRVDLVLSDMVMPEMDGLSLVEWLSQGRSRRSRHHGHGDARHLDGARSHPPRRLRLHSEAF